MEASLDPRTDGELLAATAADPEAFAVFYRRRGQADDSARRALGMAPITLSDEGIERIEALAGSRGAAGVRAIRDKLKEAEL